VVLVGKSRYISHPPLSFSQFLRPIHLAKHSIILSINPSIIEKGRWVKVGIFHTHHYQFRNLFFPILPTRHCEERSNLCATVTPKRRPTLCVFPKYSIILSINPSIIGFSTIYNFFTTYTTHNGYQINIVQTNIRPPTILFAPYTMFVYFRLNQLIVKKTFFKIYHEKKFYAANAAA
jgi:hypothetical protein